MMYRGIVLRHQKTKTRKMLEELGWALLMVVLGGLLAWMVFCAPEVGAEETHETLSVSIMNENIESSSICFENLEDDPYPAEICYYSTRTDIPLPEFRYRIDVRLYVGRKETLSDVVRILGVLSGGKGDDL